MILSILVTLLVLLIAYWWGNQGLFDSFIHFTCVVIAGVLAFALWEPITVGFLLNGGGFDSYAWGVTLGFMFLILLFLLRVIIDLFTPKRPTLPRWVNLSFGAVLGLFSGILTMGITLIAIGHIASTTEILGYTGWVRSPDSNGRPLQSSPNSPPTLVMGFTQGFFNMLSNGSCSPLMGNTSMASLRPAVAQDGGSLFKDSLREGRGNSTLAPGTFTVDGFYHDPKYVLRNNTMGAYAVMLTLQPASFDRGGSYSMSCSQARLIAPTANGAIAEFPIEFSQEKKTNDGRAMIRYTFQTATSTASLEDSSGEGKICLIFADKPFKSAAPTMLLVKGLRMTLPTVNPNALALGQAVENAGQKIAIAPDDSAPSIPASELRIDNQLSSIVLSKNSLPGTLKEENGSLNAGAATRITKNPQAKGDVRSIAQSNDEKIVKLTVSRETIADLFNVDKTRKVAEAVGLKGVPTLMDQNGNLYEPFGYIWVNTVNEEWEIYLEKPDAGFTVKQLQRGSEGYIDVLYRLPIGIEIQMVILRDPSLPLSKAKILGTTQLKVEGSGKAN